MASTVFPAAAGGGIKLVQRGQATSSGNTTITAIDTTKAFVRSFSEGASGTVATNSNLGLVGPSPEIGGFGRAKPSGASDVSSETTNGQKAWSISAGMSGGTMDATTKQMGVYIVNSTTITATGACRWEVVEFA